MHWKMQFVFVEAQIDIEVDVAFDSEGKVSLSSPITDGGTELTPDPDAESRKHNCY